MRVMSMVALLVGCVLLCNVAGLLGVLLTDTGNTPWYQSLQKPSFNPPDWIFAPVWTLLYVMMGIGLWLLLRQWPASRWALAAFGIQLLLNALWSPVFFGLHNLRAALGVIVAMWLAILATILLSWPISPAASLLLVPCFLWVSFATLLNAAIARLNPG